MESGNPTNNSTSGPDSRMASLNHAGFSSTRVRLCSPCIAHSRGWFNHSCPVLHNAVNAVQIRQTKRVGCTPRCQTNSKQGRALSVAYDLPFVDPSLNNFPSVLKLRDWMNHPRFIILSHSLIFFF